ncbi:Folate-biopterin transporter [Globisporangium polare]
MTGVSANPNNMNKVEIAHRASYLSNLSQTKDAIDGEYQDAKTPDALEAEGGALREVGAPRLFSKDHVGLLFQYAAVGLVYGVLPATIYPFLQAYLNSSGTQVVTASTLVVLPWSFKVFYGIASDCFPIGGYRRRPYMIIGWTICFVMLLVMAVTPVGKPYFLDYKDRDVKPADCDLPAYAGIRDRLNLNAPHKGGKYILLMMFAAFGYLMADVSADGLVVELAQREPLAVRGTTQSTIYAVRSFVIALGYIATGFAFNGHDYGGDFDFSLSFPVLMLILAICLVPVLPITWFFIKEEKKERADFGQYMSELWEFVQNRAVNQIIFYNFFSGIFNNFSYTASSPVQLYWAKVTPINSSISSVLGEMLFVAGITIVSCWGLHWNWRWIIVVTGIIVVVIDGICTFVAVWDIFRSQWFWLGLPVAVNVPQAMGWIISTFATVELATEGNEGAIYGLMTTVTNLPSPFAATLTKIIDQKWNMTNDRIQTDDHSIRMDVTKSVIFMYGQRR